MRRNEWEINEREYENRDILTISFHVSNFPSVPWYQSGKPGKNILGNRNSAKTLTFFYQNRIVDSSKVFQDCQRAIRQFHIVGIEFHH